MYMMFWNCIMVYLTVKSDLVRHWNYVIIATRNMTNKYSCVSSCVCSEGGTDLERVYGDVRPWRPPFHASPAARKGPISSKSQFTSAPLLRQMSVRKPHSSEIRAAHPYLKKVECPRVSVRRTSWRRKHRRSYTMLQKKKKKKKKKPFILRKT